MGRLHADLKQVAESKLAYREALDIYQRFAQSDPAQYQRFADAVKAELAKLPQ